jgi:superfamily II DNA or RNA helicase
MAASLGEAAVTKDITSQAWRTALNPAGEWIPAVLAGADKRLSEVRRSVPDAGGLVIATDHEDARAYAGQLKKITGESPTVILSDDAKASNKIEEFSAGDKRWMVAVRMVSEGVDVPRLSVGVYATSTSTPLFFAQAVGRFVRSRKRGETASVFLPSVPQLMALANSMEAERDHALDRPQNDDGDGLMDLEESLMDEANREEPRASSRRWTRRRPSTACCSTAASSAPEATSAPRTNSTSSASRACWTPSRWACCCASGSTSSRAGRSARAPQLSPPPPQCRTTGC